MSTEKVKILVVDDVEVNRIILEEILDETYRIEQAADGVDAIAALVNATEKPSLVLLDIMMPRLDGFGVLKFMKGDPTLRKIPFIFITSANDEVGGLSAGAVDYIAKPFEPDIIKLRVANHIELNLYRESLEALVDEKVGELVATKDLFMETMANLVEYRSLETGEHVTRTKELTQIMVSHLVNHSEKHAKALLDNDHLALIKAAPLHDIGKIGIPDIILLKPGRLTPEEFSIIETHTIIGSDIIDHMMIHGKEPYLQHCHDICRHHHERWNGKGYPDRLAGEDIPLASRIFAIVDVFDALVSARCYKEPMAKEMAVSIIAKESGEHFDPDVVDAFLTIKEDFYAFYQNEASS